jgi:hypothetical protein
MHKYTRMNSYIPLCWFSAERYICWCVAAWQRFTLLWYVCVCVCVYDTVHSWQPGTSSHFFIRIYAYHIVPCFRQSGNTPNECAQFCMCVHANIICACGETAFCNSNKTALSLFACNVYARELCVSVCPCVMCVCVCVYVCIHTYIHTYIHTHICIYIYIYIYI